ncbi:hypothetical protein AB1Y20_012586 [Prymnesium parvum]|uniref:Uncharacterized protein n=1 Tax=Prymnesium parvum TaxID=97485 RepID=A0AB34ILT2_PRYPA
MGTVRGVLVLLCGLPAAGKSSLAAWVVAHARELARRLRRGVTVRHVSFDAVMAAVEAEAGAAEFDPALWHEARERVRRARTARWGRGAPRLEVVLLDDNMHYRSMRRAYYQLARRAALGLCTVCVPVDVELAVARDAARPAAARVGGATIRMMAAALEWPRPEVHSWERHAVTLADGWDASLLWDTLAAAASAPISSAEVDAAARAAAAAASATQTAESAPHQLDLRLRRLLAACLAALPPRRRAALAAALGEARREAIGACRVAVAAAADVAAVVDELEHSFQRSVALLIAKAGETEEEEAGARGGEEGSAGGGGEARGERCAWQYTLWCSVRSACGEASDSEGLCAESTRAPAAVHL